MRNLSSAPQRPIFRSEASRARAADGFAVRAVEVSLDASAPAAALFDGPNSVYLSPHHDDVCFSLGGIIRRRPGGRLISLFTRSAYALSAPAGEVAGIGAVSRWRAAEDEAFAAACHLNRIDLGLDDAPLHGRKPMDLAGVGQDVATLAGPLLSRLMAVAADTPTNERLTLFCPAAIGGHVNHIATMVAVVEALPILSTRYRVVFYEDLPYATNDSFRRTGLVRLVQQTGARRGTRISVHFGACAEAKLDLVRLYRSQFAAPPADCGNFSPNAPRLTSGLHEAVWDFGSAVPSLATGPHVAVHADRSPAP